jgi:hypothetical protein
MKTKAQKTNSTGTPSKPKGKQAKSVNMKKNQSLTDKFYKPSENEIRELAELIYNQRVDRGEHGTAEEDWLQAEHYLTFPIQEKAELE